MSTTRTSARIVAAIGAILAALSISLVGTAEFAGARPCQNDCHAPVPKPPVDGCQLCNPNPPPPPPPPPPPR